MTVSSSPSKYTSTGNGVTTAFSFNSPIFATDQLVVTLVDTDGVEEVQVENTDYTVSLAGDFTSATITFSVAPPSGYEVVRERVTPYTQERNFSDTDYIDTSEIERAFDEAALRARELSDRLDEAFVPTGAGTDAPYSASDRRIADVADPVDAQDAATKAWVAQQLLGVAFDESVGSLISTADALASPADSDLFATVNGSTLHKTTAAQLKALLKTYNDALYLALADAGDFATLDTLALTDSKLTGTLTIAKGGTGQGSAAAAFTALKQDATTSATGVVELATDTEAKAGSDTARAITPSNLRAVTKWVQIGEYTPSSVSEIDITSLSSYRMVRLRGYLRPATDDVQLKLRVSVSGSFDTGSNYQHANDYGVAFSDGQLSGTGDTNAHLADDIGSATGEGYWFDLLAINFNQASTCSFIGSGGETGGGAQIGAWSHMLHHLGTSARDGIRLYFTSGNIAGGWIAAEGYVG